MMMILGRLDPAIANDARAGIARLVVMSEVQFMVVYSEISDQVRLTI